MEKLLSFLLVVIVYPEDVKVESREITTKRGPGVMRTQRAWFKGPTWRHPKEFKYALADSQRDPYPAGLYFIHPDSFAQGDFDSIELSRYNFALVPVPEEFLKQLPSAK